MRRCSQVNRRLRGRAGHAQLVALSLWDHSHHRGLRRLDVDGRDRRGPLRDARRDGHCIGHGNVQVVQQLVIDRGLCRAGCLCRRRRGGGRQALQRPGKSGVLHQLGVCEAADRLEISLAVGIAFVRAVEIRLVADVKVAVIGRARVMLLLRRRREHGIKVRAVLVAAVAVGFAPVLFLGLHHHRCHALVPV